MTTSSRGTALLAASRRPAATGPARRPAATASAGFVDQADSAPPGVAPPGEDHPFPAVAGARRLGEGRSSSGDAPTEPMARTLRRPSTALASSVALPGSAQGGDPETRRSRREARQADLPSRRLVKASDGVFELPSGLRGARLSPPVLAVVGAAVVVVVAVVTVTLGWVGAQDAAEPVPTTVVSAPSETAAAQPTSAGTEAAGRPGGEAVTVAPAQAVATPVPQTDLYVHVVGHVKNPGVVTLPPGARVEDALTAAGGATGAAVLSGLNLARVLVDGEQVVVPNADGEPKVPVNVAPPAPAAPGPAAAIPASVVDLNTADQTTLETLPGVGPVLAGRIVEWRTANGRFTSVEELGEVEGVGEKKLESLRTKVRV